MSKVKGEKLMLFDADGKSLGFATSHTLTLNAETVDTSSKDSGEFGEQEVTRISWEISTDGFYSTDTYNTLFDKMLAKDPIQCYFGIKSETGIGSVEESGTGTDGNKTWTKPTAGAYKGKAIVSNLSLTANNGEYATYSMTLTGVGSIARETAD